MNHTLIWRMASRNKRCRVCGRFTIVKDSRGSYLLSMKDQYPAIAYTRTLKKAADRGNRCAQWEATVMTVLHGQRRYPPPIPDKAAAFERVEAEILDELPLDPFTSTRVLTRIVRIRR